MEPKKQWFSKLKDAFSKSLLVSNAVFGFILMGLEKLVELEFECPCSPKWNIALSSLFFIISTSMAFILMLSIQGFRRKELILKLTTRGCKCDEFILKLNDKRCSCDKSQFTLNTQEGKCDEFILKLNDKRCSCVEMTWKLIDQRCSCDKSQFTLNTQEGKCDEFILKSITERCSCEKSKFTFNMQGCKCGKSKFTQGCDECIKKTVSSFVAAFVWLILLFLDGQYYTCAKTYWKGRFVLVDKAASQKWCEPISEGNFTRQELMLRSQEWIAESQIIGMSLLVLICVGLTGYLFRECCQQKERLKSSGSGCQVPGTPPETTYTARNTECVEMDESVCFAEQNPADISNIPL